MTSMPDTGKGLLSLVMAPILAIFTAFAAGQAEEKAATSDIAIIVNPANPVDNISLSELRKLLVGDRIQWRPGHPVRLVMRQANSPEQEKLLRLVCNMDSREFNQLWAAKVFRGDASEEPVATPSYGLTSEFVLSTGNALGIAMANQVHAGVKILKINGLHPGEPGYPIH